MVSKKKKSNSLTFLDTSKEIVSGIQQETIRQPTRIARLAFDIGPHAVNNTTYWYVCPSDRILTLFNVQQTTVTTGIQHCALYVQSSQGFDKCVFEYDTSATPLFYQVNRITTPITLYAGDIIRMVYRTLTGDTVGWAFEGLEENDPLKNIK